MKVRLTIEFDTITISRMQIKCVASMVIEKFALLGASIIESRMELIEVKPTTVYKGVFDPMRKVFVETSTTFKSKAVDVNNPTDDD